uniref:Uncharacterized protein n=1 Tax=Anguilla anguilla TaxID=7936 RepID=A0A0E9UA98_ANGAN
MYTNIFNYMCILYFSKQPAVFFNKTQ